MKITKRDVGVLMLIAGFLIAFLTYKLSFSATMTEVESIQAEEKSLKQQISDLQPVKDNAQFYQDEMARFEKEIDAEVAEFPVYLQYEDGIMYMVDMTDELEVEVPSFTVSQSAVQQTVEGATKTYTLYQGNESFSYTAADYDTVKELINYVYQLENTKNKITAISMSFSEETGEITGSLNIDMYAISDGERTYEPVDLPMDSLGVENIFGEVTGPAED